MAAGDGRVAGALWACRTGSFRSDDGVQLDRRDRPQLAPSGASDGAVELSAAGLCAGGLGAGAVSDGTAVGDWVGAAVVGAALGSDDGEPVGVGMSVAAGPPTDGLTSVLGETVSLGVPVGFGVGLEVLSAPPPSPGIDVPLLCPLVPPVSCDTGSPANSSNSTIATIATRNTT